MIGQLWDDSTFNFRLSAFFSWKKLVCTVQLKKYIYVFICHLHVKHDNYSLELLNILEIFIKHKIILYLVLFL